MKSVIWFDVSRFVRSNNSTYNCSITITGCKCCENAVIISTVALTASTASTSSASRIRASCTFARRCRLLRRAISLMNHLVHPHNVHQKNTVKLFQRHNWWQSLEGYISTDVALSWQNRFPLTSPPTIIEYAICYEEVFIIFHFNQTKGSPSGHRALIHRCRWKECFSFRERLNKLRLISEWLELNLAVSDLPSVSCSDFNWILPCAFLSTN